MGAVTIDDVIDVMEAEATEDLHRLAAIVTTEDEYLRAPLGKKLKVAFVARYSSHHGDFHELCYAKL